jgi:hypothetical protein
MVGGNDLPVDLGKDFLDLCVRQLHRVVPFPVSGDQGLKTERPRAPQRIQGLPPTRRSISQV